MNRMDVAEEFCLDNGLAVSVVTHLPIDSPGDWGRYLLTFDGKITAWRPEGDDPGESEDEEVGRLKAHLLRVDAASDDGCSVTDVFDSYSQEIYDAFIEIFDPETCDFRPVVEKFVSEDLWAGSILYLESIEILPRYRGHGVGAVITQRFLETYRTLFSLALTKPYPLHPKKRQGLPRPDDSAWFGKMDYGSFAADDPSAARKLSEHWGQLGFRQIPGLEHLVWTHFPEDTLGDDGIGEGAGMEAL